MVKKKPAMKTPRMKKPVALTVLSEGDTRQQGVIIHSIPYMNGRATTLGVFIVHVFFRDISRQRNKKIME